MTQIQTVFVALQRIKSSDGELFFAFMNQLKRRLKYQGCYRSNGTYCRDVIFFAGSESQRKCISVSVPRFYLPGGEGSVSFLPDILIPHSSYTVRFILTTLLQYPVRSCDTEEFCAQRGIAPSTLYYWQKLLKVHFMEWAHSLDNAKKLCDEMLSAIFTTRSFLRNFFDACRFPFLSRCRRTTSMITFHGLAPPPPT